MDWSVRANLCPRILALQSNVEALQGQLEDTRQDTRRFWPACPTNCPCVPLRKPQPVGNKARPCGDCQCCGRYMAVYVVENAPFKDILKNYSRLPPMPKKLLQKCLTHRTVAAYKDSYEGYEFIGDGCLDVAVKYITGEWTDVGANDRHVRVPKGRSTDYYLRQS